MEKLCQDVKLELKETVEHARRVLLDMRLCRQWVEQMKQQCPGLISRLEYEALRLYTEGEARQATRAFQEAQYCFELAVDKL